MWCRSRYIAQTHIFMQPEQLRLSNTQLKVERDNRRKDPFDPTLYVPYYLGEYNPDGTVKNPDDKVVNWWMQIEDKPEVFTLSALEHDQKLIEIIEDPRSILSTDKYSEYYNDAVNEHAKSNHWKTKDEKKKRGQP